MNRIRRFLNHFRATCLGTLVQPVREGYQVDSNCFGYLLSRPTGMGEKSEAARLPNMGYPEVIRPVEKKATHGTWIDKQAMPRKYKLSYSHRSIPSTPRIRNNMRTVSSS